MSHDNQPVQCYRCEKAVERWRLTLNTKNMAWELEADCHGEMDMIVCQAWERVQLPIVAFLPLDGKICPAKWLLITGTTIGENR